MKNIKFKLACASFFKLSIDKTKFSCIIWMNIKRRNFMDFDFALTNEQMIEFVKRCFDKKKDNGKYKFEVVKCVYPVMEIQIMIDKKPYINCNIIFADDTVYFAYPHRPDVKGVITPYVDYMYKLFGENYLKYIEAAKREQIESEKAEADVHSAEITPNLLKHLKELDNELADYLSFLDSVRNNALNQ